MGILTKFTASERCRTCLKRLIKSEETMNCSSWENSLGKNEEQNFIEISSNKELQEMLEKYVAIEGDEEVNKDKKYPQNLCASCYQVLKNFENFRKKALSSAEKLFCIFSSKTDIHKIEINDKDEEDNMSSENDNSIFNLLVKDSLMEPETVLLDGNNMESSNFSHPDPFQTDVIKSKKSRRSKTNVTGSKTKKDEKIIKPKSRKTGKTKNVTDEQKAQTVELQQPAVDVKVDIEDFKIKLPSKDKISDDDDDISDNEALSNKIFKHSKSFKEENETEEEDDEEDMQDEDDPDFDVTQEKKSRKTNVKKTRKRNQKEDQEDHANELEQTTSDDSDSASITTDEEFKTNLAQKGPIPVKRKVRRNTGRSKGMKNTLSCPDCDRKFCHQQTMDAHILKVHKGEKRGFKCEMCDKAYSFMSGLKTHILDVHQRDKEAYNCEVEGCDRKYSCLLSLQRHMQYKHCADEETAQTYVCDQCGASFRQRGHLRYHLRTRHPTENDLLIKCKKDPTEKFECDVCHKMYNNNYSLKYHKLRIHAEEKKFACNLCERRFAKKFMLDQHMLVHSEEKLACEFCGRQFVRKYQVEAHIKAVHRKLKPFQCSHCPESFASRKTLVHHVYIHTGEKPYVCSICGQAYRQPTCLKNHKKIHEKFTNSTSSTDTLTANRHFLSTLLN